jgi:hypothetical protein
MTASTTQIEPLGVVPEPAPAKSPLTTLVSSLLSVFGHNASATTGTPAAPFDVMGMVWGFFDAVRRQFDGSAQAATVQPAAMLTTSQAAAVANQRPTITFNPSENVIQSNGTIRGVVHGFDPDGDALKYSVGTRANGGSVVIDKTGKFTYTPPASGWGNMGSTDVFTVKVTEARLGKSASTLVTVDKSTTAAAKFGWGSTPTMTNFIDSSHLSGWYLYDGPMDGGQWQRTPDAITFSTHTLVITGDAQGNTGGLAWWPGGAGQQYGMWEVRAKAPVGAANYNPVLLTWPDAENWPVGGEIDFMEIQNDPNRTYTSTALHYSSQNLWETSSVAVDATQWHNYAVSWTPTEITAYVDGVPYFTSTNTDHFPPGPMHLAMQLDVGGSDVAAGGKFKIAWARQYAYVP